MRSTTRLRIVDRLTKTFKHGSRIVLTKHLLNRTVLNFHIAIQRIQSKGPKAKSRSAEYKCYKCFCFYGREQDGSACFEIG